MISIQIDITKDQIEDAIVDMCDYTDEIADLFISVIERVGSPRLAKSLIGKLGDTYTYLEETFGDGAE